MSACVCGVCACVYECIVWVYECMCVVCVRVWSAWCVCVRVYEYV